METNTNQGEIFNEISTLELEKINGGVAPVPLVIAGLILGCATGLCGLAFYVGYTVGKIDCGG